jgi:hypothetical protein
MIRTKNRKLITDLRGAGQPDKADAVKCICQYSPGEGVHSGAFVSFGQRLQRQPISWIPIQLSDAPKAVPNAAERIGAGITPHLARHATVVYDLT